MSTDLDRLTGGIQMPAHIPPPVAVRPLLSGLQAVWRFPNGRGASVVDHRGSYGIEMAVLRYTGEGVDDYDLDYSTPVTDDVIGYIGGGKELVDLLTQVAELPPANGEDTGEPGGDLGSAFDALGSLRRML